MDLARNPSRYIASRAVIDDANRVWVQFGNQTSVPMRNIEISYAWLDDQGQTRKGKETYRGPLGGGQKDQINLGIRLNDASELSRRVRVEVTAAAVAE